MSSEAGVTQSLRPLTKRALREVVAHVEMTARELALDISTFENKTREILDYLQDRGLVSRRYNGHATLWRGTARGRALVDEMSRERIALVEQEAILAATDPASILPCPTCNGRRVYCATCTGSRFVTAGQAAEAEEVER